MPSGYFDSVHVPLHLPPSAYQPPTTATKNAKGKGKQLVETPSVAAKYNVVEHWTVQERDDMLRKVSMASLRRCAPTHSF